MIQLTGAAKHYGPKTLFEHVDWLVTPNERAGIVGANGTGKSTLLKILAGIEGLDAGSIVTQKGATIGYLPQEGLSLSGRTVFAECMTVFADLRALEDEQEDLARRLAELDPSSAAYAQVSDRFHHVEAEFRARDGYTIEAQVGAVLSGLGFPQRDWKRHTEEFSGGWQMRIALAKLLLEKPNLLLLDEPTNHLDLEARNWLEDYLTSYPYAFVLVSHDRYFLDVTVRKIAELWNKDLHFYTGGYTRYENQRDERRTQLQSAFNNQQDRIRQLEAFINRFRYQATKAKQVQSRIKELERIERIEIPPEEKTIHFSFPQPKASGRIVAEFKGVAKAYGDHTVFSGVDFFIERGDRVALVGVNGAGKSTLIKILAGAEPVTEGSYTLGHNAQPDYFAQDQYKELDQTARMVDDLATVAPRATNTELHSILGCFLFSEDDVFKTISVLSGGERNRYALARMLMMPSNFLLLDEPTNHLDMRAKEVLLTALQEYTGTVVFVSHDRYFIDKLATRVFEVEDGRVHVFPGNYEDYLWRKSGGPAEPIGLVPSVTIPPSSNGDLIGESLTSPAQPASDTHSGSPAPTGAAPETLAPAADQPSSRRADQPNPGSQPFAAQNRGSQPSDCSGQPHSAQHHGHPPSSRRSHSAQHRSHQPSARSGHPYSAQHHGNQPSGNQPSGNQPAHPRTSLAAPEKPARLNPIKLRQMKERQREIEEEVTRLEIEIADYETGLAHFVSIEETRRLTSLLEARRADLAALMSEWEEVGRSLEANR